MNIVNFLRLLMLTVHVSKESYKVRSNHNILMETKTERGTKRKPESRGPISPSENISGFIGFQTDICAPKLKL